MRWQAQIGCIIYLFQGRQTANSLPDLIFTYVGGSVFVSLALYANLCPRSPVLAFSTPTHVSRRHLAMPSWSSEPNGTMTAAVLTNPGPSPPAQCFSYSTTYPRPTLPSPEWILCRVHAAGLNRAELRGRAALPPGRPEFNIFQAEYHEDPPKILGEEFVGEVEEAGSSTDFKRGEKVTGFIYGGGKAYDGSYAEFTLCHRRRLYRLPPETSLSWDVVGAIPMSMWTAYGGIMLAGRLRDRGAGTSVLIHGGTSSVGIWAILLAKETGATVLATTRNPAKVDHLKRAGVDHVIFEDALEAELSRLYPRGVDIILELVGPNQILRSLNLTARYGTVVIEGVLNLQWQADGFSPVMIPPTRNLSFYTMTNSGIGSEDDEVDSQTVEAILADVIRKVESGTYPSEIFLDRTFKLAEIGEAHAYMEDNKAKGKVVVTVLP